MSESATTSIRFYVETKWSSIYEGTIEFYEEEGLDVPLPWTDELRTLVEVNQMYRQASAEAPGQRREAAMELLAETLNSIVEIVSLMGNLEDYIDLYPGLDYDTYTSSEAEMSRYNFDGELDLDAIASNPDGDAPQDILRLIPKCKWLSGVLELPLDMTPEQIAAEESSDGDNWWYIKRDVHFRVAGILMSAAGSFYREREE